MKFSNRHLLQQLGQKFAPPYACIFIDQIETKFLRTQSHQPMVWFRYMGETFFNWIHHGKQKLEEFMADFNGFNPNIQLTNVSSKNNIAFLDLDVAPYN